MTESNTMIITDESGQEREVEILLTFEDESTGHSFVLFTDPQDEEGNVYAYRYDEDGNLEFRTEAEEGDLLYDEIGSVLKIKQLQNTKQELLEALELYFRVFFLGEDMEEE